MTQFSFEPIGWIRSCFSGKFGIPRQPGLVPEARAVLEIAAPFDQTEAFRGLETFSHVWLLFVFHQCYQRPWKATVRPPRLGGNRRVGVFASRSGFRPNALGQSVVTLLGIERSAGALQLHLGGIDLLDGTPVLDIKPYLPYADAIAEAKAGYAPAPQQNHFAVDFSLQAEEMCRILDPRIYPDLKNMITGLLSQDPRPAYRQNDTTTCFGMCLWDLDIRFSYEAQRIIVQSIG